MKIILINIYALMQYAVKIIITGYNEIITLIKSYKTHI